MRASEVFLHLGLWAAASFGSAACISPQSHPNELEEQKMNELPKFVQHNDSLGSRILYTPSAYVENITSKEVQDLIDSMRPKMVAAGIGLAANQVGHPLQIFMIEYHPPIDEFKKGDRYKVVMPDVPYQVFINPRITEASPETVSFWHGCLSAADKDRGKVATYEWIDFEAFDRKGKKFSGRLDDFAAVIFQHEFRHLLGRLYFDQTNLFMAADELDKKRASGEIAAYEICGPDVPHLLSDYVVGETIDEYAQRARRD